MNVISADADTQLASETACWSTQSPLVYLKETGFPPSILQKNSALAFCHVLLIDNSLVCDSRTSLKFNLFCTSGYQNLGAPWILLNWKMLELSTNSDIQHQGINPGQFDP